MAARELALLLGLFLAGLILMPIAIYLVGEQVFGKYAGHGYADFYSEITQKIRRGDFYALLLILCPYLGWLTLRCIRYAWRHLP